MQTKTSHIIWIVVIIGILISLFIFTKRTEAPAYDDEPVAAVASSTASDSAASTSEPVASASSSAQGIVGPGQSAPSAAGSGSGAANAANSSSIDNTEWTWLYTRLGTGAMVNAPAGGKFVLKFGGEGEMTSTTDCNHLGGKYARNGEVLSFGSFFSTLMYCEGSLEQQYSSQLQLTNSFSIRGNELHLNLNRDFGTMVFARKR